jgi:cytosine/adenosine deaminase-related metal-dependent hydrolase
VSERLVIEGCAIATVDAAGSEHASGHIVIDDGVIAAIGEGRVRAHETGHRIEGEGLLATPGLVNCHHHLYQWATRGYAQNEDLFHWLVALYPRWALVDGDVQAAAANAGLAALMLSGCSTTTDHHYLFPRDGGDLLAVEVDAALGLGVRFHPCRGSMDLGKSQGGLPPDEVVEDRDSILEATSQAIDRYHDTSPGAMTRIAVAPCSPFSVSEALMTESAELARRRGVRLHTHLAETIDEEQFCQDRFGCRPVEYLERLDWLGDDVWLAHCVHINAGEVARFGETHTGVAHCPSSNGRLGTGIAPVVDLVRAGAHVGLGVDGAASNEAGELAGELRQAMLFARLRDGAAAMTARDALALGTIHGARCLGRGDEIGSLEVGKRADIALWRIDDIWRAGIDDAVAALVFGATPRVHTLLVEGRVVVEGSELRTASEQAIAHDLRAQSVRLAERAERAGIT